MCLAEISVSISKINEPGLSQRPLKQNRLVAAAMNRLKHERGLPQRITTDNGSEFAGGQMDLWAYSAPGVANSRTNGPI